MLRIAVTPALVVVWIALAAAPVSGQRTASSLQAELNDLYSQGVHAYFDGHYERSVAMLDRAAELGSRDPRVFYFRGLSLLQMGRPEQAQANFMEGAVIEEGGTPMYYPVNRSLERVQGWKRVMLEDARRDARTEAKRREQAIQLARYEAVRIAEERILRGIDRPPIDLPLVDTSGDQSVPFPGVESLPPPIDNTDDSNTDDNNTDDADSDAGDDGTGDDASGDDASGDDASGDDASGDVSDDTGAGSGS